MRRTRRIVSLTLMLMLAMLWMPAMAETPPVTLTILETSDLHGMIYSYDYAVDKPTKKTGLTRIASYVQEARKADPELLLVDCGDTLQGNMISLFNGDAVHPMVSAMNRIGYNVWNLGNHEFNYDFSMLTRAVENAKATVLLGNAVNADGSYMTGTTAYQIYEIKGVKVAIFGVNAPHIPRWEASNPEHFQNMTFLSPEEQTGKMVEALRDEVDVLIGLVHYGKDGEYGTAGMYEVAQKYPEVDAFLLGHAHEMVNETLDNGTLMLEPGSNGVAVAKLTITLTEKDGKFAITEKKGELVDMEAYPEDPILCDAMAYVHAYSVRDANKVIGRVTADFLDPVYALPGIPTALIQDTPLIDLINTVQRKYTGADVSLAALFTSSANLVAGDFKKKDSVNVYKYDNTLMAVKVTGAQLRAIMEQQAGNYYNQYRPGDVTISFNPEIRMYNYDMFSGVDYDIDISKPAGERIVNLMYRGEALRDDQELVLALNNYRFGGLVGAGLIDEKNLVFDSTIDMANTPAVRDMISLYAQEVGELSPVCDENWHIIGADLSDPAKELIYEMVEKGELEVPTSEDGRTPNVKSLNANDLREQGLIPPLEAETKNAA